MSSITSVPSNGGTKQPAKSNLKHASIVPVNKKRTAIVSLDGDYSLILGTTILERFEIEKVKEQFIKFDSHDRGFIMRYELDDVLKSMDFKLGDTEEKKFINDQLQERNVQTIDFHLCCEIYSRIKKRIIAEEEEAQNIEYIDAFVALGGNFDRTGFVNKSVIINTIKNEFGLTFEVEKLFENAHITSDNISFQDFCMMFESNEDTKSLISVRRILQHIEI